MANMFLISLNIPNLTITFNVRLDKTKNDDIIKNKLDIYWLTKYSNIFYYRRYGFAKHNIYFDPPFIIENPVDFYLISPDGKNFNKDMIERSEHMKDLD